MLLGNGYLFTAFGLRAQIAVHICETPNVYNNCMTLLQRAEKLSRALQDYKTVASQPT